MREIKLRAWDEERNAMYYGDEIESRGDLNAWLSYGELVIYRINNHGDYTELMPLQHIGLQDRNGKDIYEGDIFPPGARTNGEVTIVCYDYKQAKYKAVPLSLYKTNAGSGGWTGFDLNQFSQVIGNTYDNPELLGEVRE